MGKKDTSQACGLAQGDPRLSSGSPVWPRFADATLEHAFRASRDGRSLREVRFVFTVGVLAGLLALAVDAATSERMSEDAGEATLLLVVILSGLAASFVPPLDRSPQLLAGAWCALAAMVLLATAPAREAAYTFSYDPVGVVVLGVIALNAASLLVPRALLVCGLILGLVVAAAAVGPEVVTTHALAAVGLLSFAASWWREYLLRHTFLLRHDLERERALSDTILLNVMPERIALRIRAGEFPIADRVDDATVLFLDLVGFTAFAARTQPEALVALLNELWTSFDNIVGEQGLEKLKTIGDAYMAVVGGAHNPRLEAEMAAGAVSAGLRMIAEVRGLAARHGYALDARVGIHTGPVIAGVIGRYRYQFDVWGDTVNIASRLEEGGVAGRVHLSDETCRRVRHRFEVERHDTVELEGKRRIETFLIVRRKEPTVPIRRLVHGS